MRRIAVTGASGFIGKNVVARLRELSFEVIPIGHDLREEAIVELAQDVDLVLHLAGVNRPSSDQEFDTGNRAWTSVLVAALARVGRATPIAYASSTQADRDNPYGISKRAAEQALEAYGRLTGAPVRVLRLPNVFGKWCRPNYNSVVATYCHNVARGLPITINDPAAVVRLLYVDDLVETFIAMAGNPATIAQIDPPGPVYEKAVDEIATTIRRFRDSRDTLVTGAVGTGYLRALYATYISYLDPSDFAYPLASHVDPRGRFAEVMRTADSGQFSFFTAHPGVTRGGHYHHSKSEKFLVLSGNARFGFRNVLNDQRLEILTSGDKPRVVETVPGWAHDITNIGETELIVMLWANEVFDHDKPDTIIAKV